MDLVAAVAASDLASYADIASLTNRLTGRQMFVGASKLFPDLLLFMKESCVSITEISAGSERCLQIVLAEHPTLPTALKYVHIPDYTSSTNDANEHPMSCS